MEGPSFLSTTGTPLVVPFATTNPTTTTVTTTTTTELPTTPQDRVEEAEDVKEEQLDKVGEYSNRMWVVCVKIITVPNSNRPVFLQRVLFLILWS